MADNEIVGYIYILTNPSIPNYVKIGYADNVEERVKTLNSNPGLPFSFRVYATYGVSMRLADKKLHSIIDRLNPDLRAIEPGDGKPRIREFFAMEPEEACGLLLELAEIHGCEDRLKIWEKTAEEKTSEANDKKAVDAKKKAAAFRFSFAGIPIGAVIAFKDDPSKTAEVISDRKVRYEDNDYSLSALANILTGKETALQGPIYFTYEGEILDDLRKKAEADAEAEIETESDTETEADNDIDTEANNVF